MCLPVVAGALAAAGSLASGVQGMMQSSYEAKVARQNAHLEAERGRQSIEQGRRDARDFYRSLGALKGQQTASLAANGIDTGFGTALTIQQDTAAQGEEDAATLYRNQLERLKGYDLGRSNSLAEASAAKFKGRMALVNSVFQAGSSLMSGFQQQRAMRVRLGMTGG